MVREEHLENDFSSRSGKSQGILWLFREIWKGFEKSGYLKIIVYSSLQKTYLSCSRGKLYFLCREIVQAHLPSRWGLLLKKVATLLWLELVMQKDCLSADNENRPVCKSLTCNLSFIITLILGYETEGWVGSPSKTTPKVYNSYCVRNYLEMKKKPDLWNCFRREHPSSQKNFIRLIIYR